MRPNEARCNLSFSARLVEKKSRPLLPGREIITVISPPGLPVVLEGELTVPPPLREEK